VSAMQGATVSAGFARALVEFAVAKGADEGSLLAAADLRAEHFADADDRVPFERFVALMRAAGIPSRVVVGYLGGELNTAGDYLIVRQSDAHAWAEIWLAGRGWVRVDPTGAIAPERMPPRQQ